MRCGPLSYVPVAASQSVRRPGRPDTHREIPGDTRERVGRERESVGRVSSHRKGRYRNA